MCEEIRPFFFGFSLSFLTDADEDGNGKQGAKQQEVKKVFLSFAGEGAQGEVSEAVADALRGEGIEVYRANDEKDMLGKQLADEFQQQINTVDAFVLVVSSNYAQRKWCLLEYSVALSRQIRERRRLVLPVFVGLAKDRPVWLPDWKCHLWKGPVKLSSLQHAKAMLAEAKRVSEQVKLFLSGGGKGTFPFPVSLIGSLFVCFL